MCACKSITDQNRPEINNFYWLLGGDVFLIIRQYIASY